MVSVYIVFFNEEKYIEQSVRSVLNQSYKDLELILVDDGSTDRSLEIVSNIEDPRVRIIHSDVNQGTACARNLALEAARGEYIVCCDGDDLFLDGIIETEVAFLEKNPDILGVGVNSSFIDKDGNITHLHPNVMYTNPSCIAAAFLFTNPIKNGGMMVRRTVLDEYNIYHNEKYYMSEDYDFWFRCSRVGKLTNLQDIYYHYRIGHGSKAEQHAKNHLQYNNLMVDLMWDIWTTSGFDLTREEVYHVYKYIFCDKPVENEEAVRIMWELLRKVNDYAEQNSMNNHREISIFCRKSFGNIMRKAHCLWDKEFEVNNSDMVI